MAQPAPPRGPRLRAIAMIPARIGSTRLSMKNLALVAGHPLLAWAVRAARDAGVFERVVVNGDHPAFAEVAARYGAEFYRRPDALGSSTTQSDDVVADFLESHDCEALAWVNSIAPLQRGEEIRRVVEFFEREGLDSLITSESRQVHCELGGVPLNFSRDGKFARTQDLEPVEVFVYSLMMWRREPFLAAMRESGHAFFCGRFATAAVSRASGLIVKTAEDLALAEAALLARGGGYRVEYDRVAPGPGEPADEVRSGPTAAAQAPSRSR